VVLVTVAAGSYFLAQMVVTNYFADLGPRTQLASGLVVFLTLLASGAWILVLVPLSERLAKAHEEVAARASTIEDRLRAHENDARLQHALEIAEDEAAVLRIAEQALQVMSGGSASQLLLAGNPDGEIDQVITVGEMPKAARCNIRRPGDCPTVRRGQGMVYEDSMALSACPGLGGQIESNCAAACTPVIVAGRGAGMVRSLGETGDPDLFRMLQSLTTHANRIGTRLAVIRSMAASEMKAATDPLTGLCNRRALDRRLESLFERRIEFALVIADIDHFKKVNDTHGHEVGDRTLKLFANTLRQMVRGEDLVCRFGGEEFVLLLPAFDAVRAAQVMERVRAELPRITQRGGLPIFTVSAGVVDHSHASTGEDLLRVADELLYRAKGEGRDRVLAAAQIGAGSAEGPPSTRQTLVQ
jgi:diguanylate cyclase (GGDEF)-like protein